MFGHISFLYIHVCDQKIDLFSALLFKKILVSVLHYLFVEFKCLQSGFLCPASCTNGAIYACSKVSPGILYYNMPHPIICIMQHAAAQQQAATAGFVKSRSENFILM